MEKKQDFKLIDGQFNPSDARTILLTLINSKIQFHKLESFGITVRSSGDISMHEKRIRELSKVNEDIKKLLNYAVENNMKLKVNSTIQIELINE
ncbi:MAG: hypothetical protein JNJ41_10115 [Bacteroidia bacterium]|nr:hypothetical protein [Bacteroidia bacterium]